MRSRHQRDDQPPCPLHLLAISLVLHDLSPSLWCCTNNGAKEMINRAGRSTCVPSRWSDFNRSAGTLFPAPQGWYRCPGSSLTSAPLPTLLLLLLLLLVLVLVIVLVLPLLLLLLQLQLLPLLWLLLLLLPLLSLLLALSLALSFLLLLLPPLRLRLPLLLPLLLFCHSCQFLFGEAAAALPRAADPRRARPPAQGDRAAVRPAHARLRQRRLAGKEKIRPAISHGRPGFLLRSSSVLADS